MAATSRAQACFPGPQIKRLREAKSWSTYDLEAASKVDQSMISRLEARKTFGRPDTLLRLADALGVPFSLLFGEAVPDLATTVPLDGEVTATGALLSPTAAARSGLDTPPHGFAGAHPSEPLPVSTALDGFAVRVGLESPARVGGDPGPEHELRPGDVLVLRFLARDEQPTPGALVYATRADEEGAVIAAELRVFFVARKIPRLAAVVGDDEARLGAGWKVEAVVVEQRRMHE